MSKEKFYLSVAAIILFAAAVLGATRFFSGSEDEWVCQAGQWVKHGQPSAAMPTGKCPGAIEQPVESEAQVKEEAPAKTDKLVNSEIEVDSPLLGAAVSSPLVVRGRAYGSWYFEASFPIKIVDDQGNVLAAVAASAQGDWMTEKLVPFEATLNFVLPAGANGKLILSKDNPSGESALDKSYELPVVFAAAPTSSEEMALKIFLGSESLNPGAEDCSKVFPVERKVAKTEGVARAALEQLLQGPTAGELAEKYFTSINPGVKMNSLTIASGTATVDFDAEMGRAVGGSCRVAAIRSQITETLKQFPTVKNVVISVAGNVEEALQP